jgi:hypothetical protein
MSSELEKLIPFFDLGHQGDFDYTQIAHSLRLTPTERLRKHEGWRLFMKEALSRAELRRASDHPVGTSTS